MKNEMISYVVTEVLKKVEKDTGNSLSAVEKKRISMLVSDAINGNTYLPLVEELEISAYEEGEILHISFSLPLFVNNIEILKGD